MTSLVQLRDRDGSRRVALVEGDNLRLLLQSPSIYALAQQAVIHGKKLIDVVQMTAGGATIPYDAVYDGHSEYRLLPAFDHPKEPACCFVTGTGLTHRASVDNRNAMHAEKAELTDSMRMYQWGVEGGRPKSGEIGVSPEWFYKGNGTIVRAHGESLEVPAFAEDGGEESEIAGVYLIDAEGNPRRVGLTQGNEFSDHVFEKRNYLYHASSKLRQCSIGPELVIDADFSLVPGHARVRRGQRVIWEKAILSGEENMCHTLENMEHHHFKFPLHRRSGDVHIHFFGASAFSFGDKLQLQQGDTMEVNYQGYGRALRNPLEVVEGPPALVRAVPL
jgi:hypothetical protein